jgi:hypothetical protein
MKSPHTTTPLRACFQREGLFRQPYLRIEVILRRRHVGASSYSGPA